MQKEIDALREAQRIMQQRLREIEMTNDDMEQNDRYILSDGAHEEWSSHHSKMFNLNTTRRLKILHYFKLSWLLLKH
jgi:hypothetical protein